MQLPEIADLKKQSFDEIFTAGFQQNQQIKIYLILKRVIDIVASLFVLIVFFPLWLLIVISIKLTQKGSAIFVHERVGQHGIPFRCYKFRTMQTNVASHEFAPTSLKDPRITTIGRVLRRTSLDEIPQLWNVLKGDMSLVGPRPEMPFIVENYNEYERGRLMVKPGLTGLWQIKGRKDLPLHKNVEYDLYYIRHRSIILDLIIIFHTFGVIINGKGAY